MEFKQLMSKGIGVLLISDLENMFKNRIRKQNCIIFSEA